MLLLVMMKGFGEVVKRGVYDWLMMLILNGYNLLNNNNDT